MCVVGNFFVFQVRIERISLERGRAVAVLKERRNYATILI